VTSENSKTEMPPAGLFRHRRWRLIAVAAVLLIAGAAGICYLSRPASTMPPMPQDIPDPEVLRAVERTRKNVLDRPSNGNAWGNLGMVLMAHDFFAEADVCFAEAARLNPRSPSWPYGRGLIALKRDPAAAPRFLRQALATAGNTSSEYKSAARLQLAETFLEQQKLDEAEGLFVDEAHQQPNNGRVMYNLGLIALARRDEPTAERALTAARSDPFARKKATVQLAALAGMRGDRTAAANFEREAATLPDDPPWPDPFRDQVESRRAGRYAWVQQEDQLEQQHRFREAAEVYLKEIASAGSWSEENVPPGVVRAYARAGFNLAQAGDFEQGLKYLHEAVRLDPDNAHAHYLLAVTLFVQAEVESKRLPNSVQAKAGFRECAEKAQRAAALRPTQGSSYLYWGMALQRLGEPAAAVAPLRQGVEATPSDYKLQQTLGEVLQETGQLQEADVYLENARKLSARDRRAN
jgi:Flp pilus assembly protein TadD